MDAVTHQQSRGDRYDVGYGVLCGDLIVGFGYMSQHTSMHNGTQNEIDMTDNDEGQTFLHQPSRTLLLVCG